MWFGNWLVNTWPAKEDDGKSTFPKDLLAYQLNR